MTPQRQHVVSRVVLRRWTVDRLLERMDLATLTVARVGPKGFGVVNDFVESEPEEAEARWGEVEQRLPDVFEALDRGTLLGDADLVEVAKSCLALHAARSHTMREVSSRALARGIEDLGVDLARDPDELARGFKFRTGLDPAGPQALQEELEWRLKIAATAVLDNGATFRSRILENLVLLEAKFAGAGLEVFAADQGAGEFLIADDPTPTIMRHHPSTGPLGGVPWGKADAFLMPMGPRHTVAIGPKDDAQVVGRGIVDRCNRYQLNNACEQVAYRPGSGLRPWIESLAKGQAQDSHKALPPRRS